MKIAKLVITLVSTSFIAIGLACVLLSAIVIGVEASTGPQRAEAYRVYDNAIADANRTYDNALAVWDANNPTPAEGVRNNYIFNPTTGAGIRTTRETSIRTAERALEQALVAAKETYRDNLAAAFTVQNVDAMTNGGPLVTIGTSSRLSPMGATMISGISLLLAGGAMLVSLIFINKGEAGTSKGEAGAQKGAKKAA